MQRVGCGFFVADDVFVLRMPRDVAEKPVASPANRYVALCKLRERERERGIRDRLKNFKRPLGKRIVLDLTLLILNEKEA